MLFRELEVDDRFEFEGIKYVKTSESLALGNGHEICFPRCCRVSLLCDRARR
jgi:hypothetical protein